MVEVDADLQLEVFRGSRRKLVSTIDKTAIRVGVIVAAAATVMDQVVRRELRVHALQRVVHLIVNGIRVAHRIIDWISVVIVVALQIQRVAAGNSVVIVFRKLALTLALVVVVILCVLVAEISLVDVSQLEIASDIFRASDVIRVVVAVVQSCTVLEKLLRKVE